MFFRKKESKEEKSKDITRPGLLFAELMFYEKPTIQTEKILDDLRKNIGKVDLMTSSKDMSGFIFNNFPVKYKDATIPSQCILYSIIEKVDHEKLTTSIQQSRGWEEMNEIIEKCKYKIIFSDFLPNHADIHSRISLFNNALKCIIANLDCKALHFLSSQKIVNPTEFLENLREGDQLIAVMNVRFFRIQDSEDMLVDTVGLSIFGLPDIQCHFKELDPNQIARVVGNSGYYIFDKGDIIDDGNTIQGITKDDKWKCQHEESLAEPKRMVIDINPGFPYAAGGRK